MLKKPNHTRLLHSVLCSALNEEPIIPIWKWPKSASRDLYLPVALNCSHLHRGVLLCGLLVLLLEYSESGPIRVWNPPPSSSHRSILHLIIIYTFLVKENRVLSKTNVISVIMGLRMTLHLRLFFLHIQKGFRIFILQKRNKTLQLLIILLLSPYLMYKTSQCDPSPAGIKEYLQVQAFVWIKYVHIHGWYLCLFVSMYVYVYMYTYGM